MKEGVPRKIIHSSEQPLDAVEIMDALNEASSERMRAEWEKDYAVEQVAEGFSFDALTSARTRKYGEAELERELRILRGEEQRSGAEALSTLSVIMIDLDHFKKVNDTYGHPMGDHVLKEAVAIAKETVRDTDTVVRWGGEEFLVLMPNASAKVAEEHANEMREKIAGLSFSDGESAFSVTASFGVASSEKTTDKDELVKLADSALYAAKAGGRNQVMVDTSLPHNQPTNESLRATNE